MPSSRPDSAEPSAKCCMGVAYFNRTMEREGLPPKCLGLAQTKRGEQETDDVRSVTEETRDFKYVCLGYSSHPTGGKPSANGEATMPYCEGIEIAVTEERVAPIPAPRATQGTLSLRDQAPTLDHGQGAPVPPATEGPSDEDNSLAARFRRELRRNADGLRSVVTGERVLPLPFQFRAFESLTQARDTLVSTASVNVEKMGIMAHFLSHRTVDSAKLLWERFSSEEETE